jgi:hypothetical protein
MLAGALVKEAVRCGKKNCRCFKGARLHKWYYYLYWRDYQNGGTLKKEYVPRADLQSVRRTIKTAKEKDNKEKVELRLCHQLFKQLL